MTVINAETALYAALKFLPEGAKLTVYTKDPGRARTNAVAVLRKEPGGGWNDWQILKRPVSADSSLLPATWPTEDPAVISSRDLADVLSNSDLWADVDD
jgi:hypothetical protein